MDCVILTSHPRGPAIKTAGPYRIATELRQNGFTVQVIDISSFRDVTRLSLLLRKFVTDKTLWLGFSNTFMDTVLGTPWHTLYDYERDEQSIKDRISELIAPLRRRYPNLRFIYGDAGARTDITDIGIVRFHGYVDQQVLEFTKECARDSVNYQSVIYKREFDGFCQSRIDWQANDLLLGEQALPLEISRGCIFKCAFCRYPLNGKKKLDYIKDTETLYSELMRNYELYGVKDYLFTDDTYNDSLVKIRQIKSVLDRLPFRVNFSTYLRLDLMLRHPDMAAILAESGLIGAFFGIETRDPVDAKFIGKNAPFQDQIDYLWKLKQDTFKKVMINSGFILGLPNDSWDKIDSLFEWLKSDENPLDSFTVTELRIFPQGIAELPYESEIDKNYASMGYEFVGNHWVNKNNGIDGKRLTDVANEFNMNTSYKSKVGPFHMMDLLNLGLDKQDLLSLTIDEIKNKYDLKKINDDVSDRYQDTLLKLSV